jgi:hypothetical protein
MSKQLVECDFSTKDERGFTWFINHQGKATVTLLSDGTLEFSGVSRKILIENIGTEDETITVLTL